MRADDIAGVAVALARRIVDAAGPNQVLVSGTVKDLVVGSTLHFSDAGIHELKGIPGSWQLWEAGE
jgi:class 3 adenylate cyclase